MADQTLLEAVAAELDVIASWHDGPRQHRVAQLAEKVRAAAGGEQVSVEDVAAYTLPSTSPAPQYSEEELAELARLEAESDNPPGT
jgi:hypothetical protein